MNWPESHTGELIKLWAAGLSARDCAAQINQIFRTGYSRNAIIAKVHRLQLARRRPSPTTYARSRKPRSQRPQRGLGRDNETPKPRHSIDGPHAECSDDLKVQTSEAVNLEVYEGDTPPGERVGVLELTDTMCRWPLGELKQEGFGFCAKPVAPGHRFPADKPYCPMHLERARD